ncbi:DUF3611 family protein [Spirulina sp. 06S082]|uniref:DUF3611 family protein n=1 Tax=Spirulina sp. 06S082 TaxID=3110248 RepID=UPI003A4D3EDB
MLAPTFSPNLKSGISLLAAIRGIATLGLNIYWFFCYVHLGQKLSAPEAALHPSRKEVIQIL